MAGIGIPTFTLVDHFGQSVTEASFPGKALLVYFGFTHCRVVCPRSLGRLASVIDRLPASVQAQIAPLYITVDPERDTPERMRNYLTESYPRFTGLTGTSEQIDAAKKAFKVFAQRKEDPEDPDGYAVPHSAISYLIGADGAYANHWVDTKTDEYILNDLTKHFSCQVS